jgi:hypothetical protein
MTYLPQGTRIKIKEGQPLAGLTGTIKGISTSGAPVIGVGYIIEPDDKSLIYSEMYPYDIFCAFDVMFEVEWDEKDNPNLQKIIDKMVEERKARKLWNRLHDELGLTDSACDKIVDLVEDWILDEQSSAGSQNVNTELLVDGFNDCVRQMKEMLR